MMNHTSATPLDGDHWGQIKVLIVDDQKSAAFILKHMMNEFGIEAVDIATSESEAFNLCRMKSYSIIIVDFHLDGKINGCELVDILVAQELLPPDCGLMMISGDHTVKTAMTVISSSVDEFLLKPVSSRELKEKLHRVYETVMLRRPIQKALAEQGISQAITVCKMQLGTYGYQFSLIQTLVELLIKNQDWQQIQRLLPVLKKHSQHPFITRTEARLHYHQGDFETATKLLEYLLRYSPLTIEAIDELVIYHESAGNLGHAFKYASKALALTPRSCNRILSVFRLSATFHDTETLANLTRQLAESLPLMNDSWRYYLAECCASIERTYSEYLARGTAPQYRHLVKTLVNRARLKLPAPQKTIAIAYGYLTFSRLYLLEQNEEKARRCLMKAFARFFHEPGKLPADFLVKAIFPSLALGELYLATQLYAELELKEKLCRVTFDDFHLIQHNEALTSRILTLFDQVKEAHQLSFCHQQHSLSLYQQLLQDFPYSSEVNLGYLHCLLASRFLNDQEIEATLRKLKAAPLPIPHHDWLMQLTEKYHQCGFHEHDNSDHQQSSELWQPAVDKARLLKLKARCENKEQ
ncbi:response regulator [Photobacterium sp. MCCC 1A19761]|uniref:response regulator n=1 Tax=Photobacterium sp. MCCC 1A19761 TaxID=3115000 RepID=UPI00307CDE38